MFSFLDGIRDISFLSVMVRLALSCACAALIGLERSAKNRPAGFRTHILVCMGAAVAAATGIYLTVGAGLPSDISRISAQVISGLGFIGAGTIIVTRKATIKGLTTAAGLWTTGIIGLAIGSGYYELGVIGTVLVLLTETVLAHFAKNIRENPEFDLEILYNEKDSLDKLLRSCKNERMAITNLRIKHIDDGDAKYVAQVSLRGNAKCEDILNKVSAIDGIVAAERLW